MEQDVKLTKLSRCAGCGAKVGAGVLARLLEGLQVHRDPNLLVGFDRSDDASVYRLSDELALVQTVDFFPPIADDPYLFGQIAAANALSDVYAMGGEPKLALNLMCVPRDMPDEAVHRMLRGGYDKVYEAGCLITGGHSIFDDEPKYGLAVTGFVRPDRVLTNSGARPGDVLLLTKPLGVGVLSTAHKGGMASEEGMALAYRLMTTLNRAARDVLVKYRVHACTDVTGFGGTCWRWPRAAGCRRWSTRTGWTSSRRPWSWRGWGSCPRGCTATAALPPPGWTRGRSPCTGRTCSTTPRPPAACWRRWTRTTRRPPGRSSGTASPAPSGSGRWRSGPGALGFFCDKNV